MAGKAMEGRLPSVKDRQKYKKSNSLSFSQLLFCSSFNEQKAAHTLSLQWSLLSLMYLFHMLSSFLTSGRLLISILLHRLWCHAHEKNVRVAKLTLSGVENRDILVKTSFCFILVSSKKKTFHLVWKLPETRCLKRGETAGYFKRRWIRYFREVL